jgi:hypothetical protein
LEKVLELEEFVEELKEAAAFEERWGYLIQDADTMRKRALYLPWPFRVIPLLRADFLEAKYSKLEAKYSKKGE